MSRRSVPPIAPQDLRDHADDARIDRIWERLENDLSGTPVAAGRPRRSAMFALAFAATFAAFAGGLVVGKRVWSGGVGTTAIHAAPDRVEMDIFAAGEQGRTYDLPGVGQLRLKPGATVELDKSAGGVTLRLVQGEASVDKVGVNGVAMVAGEARLSSLPGSSVTMQKHDDDVDVRVDDGSADLASPNGTQHLQSGEGAQQVPIHSTSARADRNTTPKRRVPAIAPPTRPGDPAPEGAAAAPGVQLSDNAAAYKSLKARPDGIVGAINAAPSSAALIDIYDAAIAAGDEEAPSLALNRILASFPNEGNAQIAAYKLMKRATNEADRRKYAARLSPNGPFAENAACSQITAAKNQDDAKRLANAYLSKFTNASVCKEEAERIIKGEESFDEGDAAIAPRPTGSALAAPVAPLVAPKSDPKP